MALKDKDGYETIWLLCDTQDIAEFSEVNGFTGLLIYRMAMDAMTAKITDIMEKSKNYEDLKKQLTEMIDDRNILSDKIYEPLRS